MRVYVYMNIQPSYAKGPHLLFWASSQAAHGNRAINGIPNRLNYCVIVSVYT